MSTLISSSIASTSQFSSIFNDSHTPSSRYGRWTAATLRVSQVRPNVVLDIWMRLYNLQTLPIGYRFLLRVHSMQLGAARWLQRVLQRRAVWPGDVIDRILSFLVWQP